MEKTFDEMMYELKEGEPLGGRKLTFAQKCGAFAALYGGARNMVVARAFDLSPVTVSKLSGCLERDPDPYRREYKVDASTGDEVSYQVKRDHNRGRAHNRARHYPDVAEEFEALGREEFTRKYYTTITHARIMQAKEALRREAKTTRRLHPQQLEAMSGDELARVTVDNGYTQQDVLYALGLIGKRSQK